MRFIKYSFLFLIIGGIGFVSGFLFIKKINIRTAQTPTPTTNSPGFSLENAPSESLRGQITSMTGDISLQDRTATEAAKISVPVDIQQGENLITGKGSGLSLIFQNACNLIFFENTEVDIIQTLPADLVFSQVTGTAEYIKAGSYPLDIRTSSMLTRLDGDALLTRDPQKPIVTLSVKSGSAVAAYNDLNYVSHEISVAAGQTYTFNYGTRKGVLK